MSSMPEPVNSNLYTTNAKIPSYMAGKSLFTKVWDAHVVEELPGENNLIFMDQ